MTKTAISNKTLTDVELEIKNIGDRPAVVNVYDTIPDGFSLENGLPTWSGFLDAGKSANMLYSLKGSAASLPAADATYRDIRGTMRQAQSNTVQNNKISGSNKIDTTIINAGPDEIMIFMISSFLVISGIIASAAFTAHLITRIRSRSK